MTAPNPVVTGERPAPAVAGAGRETTAAWSTTTKTSAYPAYPTARPEWMSWDEVTVTVNPALLGELAGSWCDWCAEPGQDPVIRVDCDAWWGAKEVCEGCSRAVIVHAANFSSRVLVETAS